mgnify:CR=1 FL=1
MPYIETIFASSDLIDVKVDHGAKTVIIKSSNRTNFAGIDFDGTKVFSLRLVAKFFKERFPSEVESDDFDDGSVDVLSASVKAQKLLQVEPIPYHLIRILNYQLNNNTLNINDDYWKRTEDVEQKELNEEYPLETVETWLTERDSYDVNVYGLPVNV